MADLVIGGVSQPRFLCCGMNLVTNDDFEDNADGWLAGNSATVVRVADSETFFGDYSLQINDASASLRGYVDYILNPGVTGTYTFVISIWARGASGSDVYMRSALVGGVTAWGTAKTLTTTQQHFSDAISYNITGVSPRLRIYPTALAAETGNIIIDHVSVYRATNDITLDYESQVDVWGWERENQAENRLIDGTTKIYVNGWRFSANLDFTYLSADDEANRGRISEADTVVFFPRSDNEFCANCRWDGKYDRSYFHRSLYTAGHKGPITLVGVELLEKKPTT